MGSNGTKVIVVDADTYEMVGEIPDTQGVHRVRTCSGSDG